MDLFQQGIRSNVNGLNERVDWCFPFTYKMDLIESRCGGQRTIWNVDPMPPLVSVDASGEEL
jgi:hypothetical protein